MTRDEDGWWFPAEPLPDDGIGEFDYGFILDDSDTVLPDPRSRRQPDGVHGWSRTFDADEFVWSDQKWTGKPACRLHHLRTAYRHLHSEGTLMAAIDRLDHLVRARDRLRRADAGQCLQRPAQLGLRRRALVRRTRGLWRPARLHAVRRCVPSGRSWSHPGRRLQPSRSERQLPVTIRALLAERRRSYRLGR